MIPTVSGTIADWKTDLGRIQSMGFNAIHMLPITALDSAESPYAASDLFDLDKSYLIKESAENPLSQLAEFVEAAMSLGIRLCFDLVLNHIGVDSTMARKTPDWIVPDENRPDGFMRAWYWSSEGKKTWEDLVLINYEHPSEATRLEIFAYMADYALFWAKYADYTGGFVRFDNLHSSDPEFVRILTDALHAEYPGLGVLAEFFTDEQSLLAAVPNWGLNLILATPWNYRYAPELRDYLKFIHRVSGQVRYFMPVTTHDSGSPAQEFGTADSTIPRYVAAALLGTGATGIPQGVEFGETERIKFIGRKPKMMFPSEAKFAPFIRKVNGILRDHNAFRCGENCEFVDNGHQAIIAAFRRDSSSESSGFLIACNFDISSAQSLRVDLTSFIGTRGPFLCSDLLEDAILTFESPLIDVLLPPCAAQVLKFSKGNLSPTEGPPQ
jgi:hypothetical protein